MILKTLYIHERDMNVVLVQMLMIKGGKKYHDLLEELFFLHTAKHRGFKNNLIQSIYFRFRIQNHWRPNQEFFWTHSSTFVNVALSYEK